MLIVLNWVFLFLLFVLVEQKSKAIGTKAKAIQFIEFAFLLCICKDKQRRN